MYLAKENKFDVINQRQVAKKVGINEATMCRIVRRKQRCSKMTAYCIVKAICELAEIEDYFEKEGE